MTIYCFMSFFQYTILRTFMPNTSGMFKYTRLLVLLLLLVLFVSYSKAQDPSLIVPGIITTVAGTSTGGYNGDNIQATSAQLNNPYQVIVDNARNVLYISEETGTRVRQINRSSGIITSLLTGAAFTGLALDSQNNILYVAETTNHRIRYYNLNTAATGIYAGSTVGFAGDNGAATSAKLYSPRGLAYDSTRRILYIADTSNARIRAIDTTTSIITTVVGSGGVGSAGDGGLATSAQLFGPVALAVDVQQNLLYIGDYYNYRVRVVNRNTSIINTYVGTVQGYGGDYGAATSASINSAFGLALDTFNNLLYIADYYNQRVRAVNRLNNVIYTFAGYSSVTGFSGDGSVATGAQFNNIASVTVDTTNNLLYVVDYGNHRVRVISLLCKQGYYGNVSNCQACLQGSYSSMNGSSICQLCPAGTFSTVIAATSASVCQACSSGNYSSSAGSSMCLTCPIGTYSQSGATNCTTCPSGTIANYIGASTCMACPAGFYSYNTSMCQVCPLGSIASTSGSSTCTLCAAGTFAINTTACLSCPQGTYSTGTGNGMCTACVVGTYSSQIAATSSATCIPCAQGTYSQAGASSCYNTCAGKSASDVTVCSSHGNCTAPNTCTCTSGYIGFNCETLTCFGVAQGNASVCSGHGMCIGVDTCNCTIGYNGSKCELPICACLNGGICVAPNTCNCTSGYYGSICQYVAQVNITNNTNNTSNSTTSTNNNASNNTSSNPNNGTSTTTTVNSTNTTITNTTSNNNTTMNNNNTTMNGTDTNNNSTTTIVCFGKGQNDMVACSGKGKCIEQDTCSCLQGYSGQVCEFYTCFGINSTSPSACSGNGMCSSLNVCTCKNGFNGTTCQEQTSVIVTPLPSIGNAPSTLTPAAIGAIVATPIGVCLLITLLTCCSCFMCLCVYKYKKSGILVQEEEDLEKGVNISNGSSESSTSKNNSNEKQKTRAILALDERLYTLKFADFTDLKEIGRGGSGSIVFRAKWKSETVAIKIFQTNHLGNNENNFGEFEREVRLFAYVIFVIINMCVLVHCLTVTLFISMVPAWTCLVSVL
jgi:hypothetical protein